MSASIERKSALKRLLVEHLLLKIEPGEIPDDQPLFGPGGLGLDSIDALQLVIALEGAYGLKIADPAKAKTILASVNTIAAAVEALPAPPAGAA